MSSSEDAHEYKRIPCPDNIVGCEVLHKVKINKEPKKHNDWVSSIEELVDFCLGCGLDPCLCYGELVADVQQMAATGCGKPDCGKISGLRLHSNGWRVSVKQEMCQDCVAKQTRE